MTLPPPTVPVRIIMPDLAARPGQAPKEVQILCRVGATILAEALEHGIPIEHACGGVCACSTCHIHVRAGAEHLSPPQIDEQDRVEEAPDLQRTSRLACQCVITGPGPIVIQVPAWNRNAVKETPH